MIAIRDMRVVVGHTTLLDDISLDIADGERVAIVGPNGAGKSTLLAAIAGDLPLARGSIALRGRDLRTLSVTDRARLRAVLLQRSELALAFTALEVVQLAARTISVELARDCLDRVGMAAFASRTYPTLSGGEQQRVQLARVLAQLALSPTAALLLDEPTSALDPHHQRIVLACAHRAAIAGHAVVVVLHDLTLAARWADRVVLLSRGRIAHAGDPESVLHPDAIERVYGTPFERLHGAAGLALVPR